MGSRAERSGGASSTPRSASAAWAAASMTIAPPLTEAAFMAQVTQYAELRGWEWVHCRAGRTVDSWRTPMSGTMAKGWPDLVLVKGDRLIFMEVKRTGGKTTHDQDHVVAILSYVGEAVVVEPKDWEFIEDTLR